MLFGLIKSNEEKIQEHEEFVGNYLYPIVKFNDKITSPTIDELQDFTLGFLSRNGKARHYKHEISKFLVRKKEIKDAVDYYNQLMQAYSGSPKVTDYLLEKKDSIESYLDLNEKFDILIEKIKHTIINYEKIPRIIREFEANIEGLNLVYQEKYPEKVVSKISDDINVADVENGVLDNLYLELNKSAAYVEICTFLDDLLVTHGISALINEDLEQSLKQKWINIWNDLSFETFSQEIYNEFEYDKSVLGEYRISTRNYMENRELVLEQLSDLRIKSQLNSVIVSWLGEDYKQLEKEYKEEIANYLNQRKLTTEVNKSLGIIYNKTIGYIESYNKILSPLNGTLSTLNIHKEEEIQDVRDYYLYSIIKSLEQYLAKYGMSKEITEAEAEEMVYIVEKNLYTLTDDQKASYYSSVEIMNQKRNASCLIQGDVSSGKTIVTVMLMFLLAKKGMKSVYIVPRKILKLQHMNTLRKYNELFGLNLKIEDGESDFDGTEVDIVINGYSFTHKKFDLIEFDLGVIDEIQLLGVEQRNQIQNKYQNIDMFYTTATPHPRTKLISLIGNMDILEIRQMPPGRKLKETSIFSEIGKEQINRIKEQAAIGYMTLVVCPLVNKVGFSPYENIHQALEWYRMMFPNLRVEKLLSTHSEDTKNLLIEESVNGQIDILIATSSIEVGIDIPCASIMVIHYGYSKKIQWGVSQLHQLRGRIGRGNQDAYCYIEYPGIPIDKSPVASVLSTQDVFKLTENDFDWRGFEKIIGTRQSGKKGRRVDQEKRIEAYKRIAQKTPQLINELDKSLIEKIEQNILDARVADLN